MCHAVSFALSPARSRGRRPGDRHLPRSRSRPAPALPAGAQDAPDGSRSTITQQVVHREPLAGGGWRITIEATLDSNAVCHVFLLQCVVEPQVVTPHMKLQSLECVSPAWVNIEVTLPIIGTNINVCRGSTPNTRAGTSGSGTSSSPTSTWAPSTRRFASSDSRRSSSSSRGEHDHHRPRGRSRHQRGVSRHGCDRHAGGMHRPRGGAVERADGEREPNRARAVRQRHAGARRRRGELGLHRGDVVRLHRQRWHPAAGRLHVHRDGRRRRTTG